ncbi:hypothetical protein [Neobacillus sp. D3-1R]|uniref:hypothetical protein n=1 Tax=Neobacillus sp. D3-1R TaxID=3445778 RepID=UPI003F9F62B8
MEEHEVVTQAQAQCPDCGSQTCEPTDLLCVNIPCTTTVVLLGLVTLTLGPVCLKVSGADSLLNLTEEQKLAKLQQVFGALGNALPRFTA